MANGKFRLLEAFRKTFAGTLYKHRDSTLGNKIGRELFEDLLAHELSPRYLQHVDGGLGAANRGGKIHTPKEIRRNDSIFGKPPAGVDLRPAATGYRVPEGPVAEPRIGCEVKIIAKSQQKQIDRVISDLENFGRRIKTLNKKCINVAVVGVNHESDYVGYEGDRSFRHTLRAQEPAAVMTRLKAQLIGIYDELLILRFRATNQPPYPFSWLDVKQTELDYGAALTRVAEIYQQRFR
ncbi:MAG: hypothetical protein HYY95_14775 [Candidatus Rokubacteria bacterium]|nr:hypothetical protein [Candidatus Rokubacteria bacterium]